MLKEHIEEMQIRRMTKRDLDFALHLISGEGWTNTRLDFEELLAFDPKGCFIAEVSGEKVGMVCSTRYNGFGFVSNLIVDREHRGKHYGTVLMKHILSNLEKSGVVTQLLDGVVKAIPLYERLGFAKKYRSLRLEGILDPQESTHVRNMTMGDLEGIDEFDTEFFGASREKFLRSRLKHFPSLCKIIERKGEVTGYIMGSECGEYVRIGPWVMRENLERAEELLRDFAIEVEGKTLKIGVLENNSDARRLLDKYKFREISYSWRMLRGREGTWTFSNSLYAICCAARG